ncbi:uncharacterized protein MICPUCDRAFT_29852 [Micromonas pusilla CCMP1545]|uniref:AP-3 complex subunit delta n=2 Tax=Micromonas pusilla TaxID=38833 RepID=C1N6S4_MICPC|nr:uncharacterized protein MICPUCDRAFT_29852 [Micromonas pusilla CCMP1545]EEH52155.1 predicted protein [Micromonas pusilla CCMP1545]|eukprot:XP_003063782.1 predicted protein [Micromonas pusilla CCMP1545]
MSSMSSLGSQRRLKPESSMMGSASTYMFQKNLKDMITAIRAQKGDGSQKNFINKCLQDIRTEIVSPDVRTKAVALEKATYLHTLGFNMNWASFHVVELMSVSVNVKYKRVGYLAATQSFGDDTDVVLLIPNLLKKDLASPNPAEAALAISCLGNIVTPELSQTLVADVYSLLNNHKPDLRRRACLCLYKCFLRYPEALRPSFARLTECLEDDDQSVVQAAVTVLSELAMHNPKTYLPLAPKFYKLLTTSSSNWMTIKLVKVFGALTPLEPRLAKKLVGPLSEILETTSAKSLMYECIRTVVGGMTTQEKIVRQAVDKLKDMLDDQDPNIKYLALHALTFLLETHPRIVAEHKGNIFGCVEHEDSNIQYCALKIVRGLVTKKTLMDTTAHLMGAMGRAEQRFRDELVWSVVHVCMNDRYALVTDFVWYLTVLADLVQVPASCHGGLVGEQLIDICLRVEVVRESAVAILKPLLLDGSLLESTPANKTVPEALKSIAWIIGEYACFVTDHAEVIKALSNPSVTNLPAHAQAVYVQSLLKVYASAIPEAKLVPMTAELTAMCEMIQENLKPFKNSLHLEVRERSCQLSTILELASSAEDATLGRGTAIMEQFSLALSEEIQPVSHRAQKKVEAPAALGLSAPLSKEWDGLLLSSDDEDDEDGGAEGRKKRSKGSKSKPVTDLFTARKTKEQIAREEKDARKMLKSHREKQSMYYLGDDASGEKKKKGKKNRKGAAPEVEAAPEPELTEYMKQSYAGNASRPVIKGEDDDSSEEEYASEYQDAGAAARYAPKVSASDMHAGLGTYDPLAPLARGEDMPTVEAYPTYDPYENEGGGRSAFQVPERRERKHKSERKKEKEKEKKAKAKKAAKKAAKKEKEAAGEDASEDKKGSGKEKKEKKSKSSKADKVTEKLSKASID